MEDFLPEFSEKILPIVVRAYFNEDLEYLQTVCVGEAHRAVVRSVRIQSSHPPAGAHTAAEQLHSSTGARIQRSLFSGVAD